jgi:hypothetical protein
VYNVPANMARALLSRTARYRDRATGIGEGVGWSAGGATTAMEMLLLEVKA